MIARLKMFAKVMKRTVSEFSSDNCMRMAAALSYYTVFALPAVIVIVISVAGIFVDEKDVQGRIQQEMQSALGEDGAQQFQTMIKSADQPEKKGGRTIFGIVILVVGATGVMSQLQGALNEAWGIPKKQESAPKKKKEMVRSFVVKRLISLALVLAVAVVLIVSLVLDTVIVAFGRQLAGEILPGASRIAIVAGNVLTTYFIFMAVFALMYKYLPDAKIAWRHVWLGSALTALLFVFGKWVLSYYLAHRDFGSSFGAAGSLALILVWVYYSGVIFLFGAEFTQVWAKRHTLEDLNAPDKQPPEPL